MKIDEMITITPSHLKRPPEIERIREMAGSRRPAGKDAGQPLPDTKSPFIIKQAEDWLAFATKTEDQKMLFDRFWHEGEVCILFADTNMGKSILAVQIGDSIAQGRPIGNFAMQAKPAKVLYLDLELTAKQFEARYCSAAHGHYRFSKNFLRAVINPDATGQRMFNSYAEYMDNAVENTVIETRPKVLILDNITCLSGGTHMEPGATALMRNLQAIKSRYQLSILVLAHTPKRNPAKPMTRNDLHGSKMLINFCDSAFAIGQSQLDSGLRYLKQVKQRSSTEFYGADNICLCRISKPANFIQFEVGDMGREADHLLSSTEIYLKDLEERIFKLNSQGLSLRKIAAHLNISCTTVHRNLKKLEEPAGLKAKEELIAV